MEQRSFISIMRIDYIGLSDNWTWSDIGDKHVKVAFVRRGHAIINIIYSLFEMQRHSFLEI